MKYIILLRGINISGKNKIAMKQLKEVLSESFSDVITYLNSGNIILEAECGHKEVADVVASLIRTHFDLEIPVFVITFDRLEDILIHHPQWWATDDKKIYDNLIFLIPPLTFPELYDAIGEPSEGLERIQEYENAVFWSFDLGSYQKANWWKKTANTAIRDQITVRTANTMYKVLELCNKK